MTPLLVLGGWLGAGKTTLLNHLLRHAQGRKLAVLVNDFGSTSIDADLIVGHEGDVLALAGGCICCSYGADLVSTLQATLQRGPDAIVLECSGVALPAAVVRTARLCLGIQVAGVVGVADASSVQERLADAYVADTVAAQLAQADLVVLNQVDRASPAGLAGAMQAVAAAAGTVPVLQAVQGQVPVELVLGLQAEPSHAALSASSWAAQPLRAAAQQYRHEQRACNQPLDVQALAAELSAPGSPVLRAKGFVRGLDGQRWLLHTMGRRAELTPWPQAQAWPGERLVVISRRTD